MRNEAVNRVKLVFTLFDADGNGVLESDDFDLMSSRVAAAVPDADEAQKQAMQAGFTRYWNTLAAELDANHDGRITYDEYQACVLSPERFSGAVDEFAAGFARLGDLDGSGTVTRPVFSGMLRESASSCRTSRPSSRHLGPMTPTGSAWMSGKPRSGTSTPLTRAASLRICWQALRRPDPTRSGGSLRGE